MLKLIIFLFKIFSGCYNFTSEMKNGKTRDPEAEIIYAKYCSGLTLRELLIKFHILKTQKTGTDAVSE